MRVGARWLRRLGATFADTAEVVLRMAHLHRHRSIGETERHQDVGVVERVDAAAHPLGRGVQPRDDAALCRFEPIGNWLSVRQLSDPSS